MKININKCDLCKKEVREDENRTKYSRSFGNVILNFKDQYHIQEFWRGFLCYFCAKKIYEAIHNTIAELEK